MDERKKRLLAQLYFARPAQYFWKYLAALLVFGLLLYDYGIGRVAIGLSACGIAILLFLWIKAPSDAQVDQWLGEDLAQLQKAALAKLGIEEDELETEPLLILGRPVMKGAWLQWRKGRDGVYRFGVHQVVVILQTEYRFGIYSCLLNFPRDIRAQVRADEYQYRDVVGVSLAEDVEVSDGEKKNEYRLASGELFVPTQTFRISLSNGESFQVQVAARNSRQKWQDEVMATDLDRTIAAVRKMLRERRSA